MPILLASRFSTSLSLSIPSTHLHFLFLSSSSPMSPFSSFPSHLLYFPSFFPTSFSLFLLFILLPTLIYSHPHPPSPSLSLSYSSSLRYAEFCLRQSGIFATSATFADSAEREMLISSSKRLEQAYFTYFYLENFSFTFLTSYLIMVLHYYDEII